MIERPMTSRDMDNQRFVSQIAEFFCDRGFRSAVLVVLDAGRPLAFLGGQLIWIFQPFASLFFPRHRMAQLAHILEDPQAVDQLIHCLADRSENE
jgi:hypothetical protein